MGLREVVPHCNQRSLIQTKHFGDMNMNYCGKQIDTNGESAKIRFEV
jgi:hypothetical protein